MIQDHKPAYADGDPYRQASRVMGRTIPAVSRVVLPQTPPEHRDQTDPGLFRLYCAEERQAEQYQKGAANFLSVIEKE